MEQPSQIKNRKNISHHIKHNNLKLLVSAALALLVFFLLKRYAFDIAKINNNDMLSSYAYGDALLIKKISCTYAYGDVIYFEYPKLEEDSSMTKTFFFQRIVALPGDTFELSDKAVFLNGVKMPEDSGCRHNYIIKTKGIKLDSVFKEHYRLSEGGEISDEFAYSYSLTKREALALQNDSIVKSLELKTEKKNTADESCFPWSLHYTWNADHYGKIYLPKMKDTLRLDTLNIHLYQQIICGHEKNKLEVKHDSIFIDDRLTTIYVVKKNYYFVMGDNRDNANDSRRWGFLPENLIKGKVIARLKKAE